MPIFKVRVDTYWVVEADNEHEAIDRVADREMIDFCSDYDNFDVSVMKKLSGVDRICLLRLHPTVTQQMHDIIETLRPRFKLLSKFIRPQARLCCSSVDEQTCTNFE